MTTPATPKEVLAGFALILVAGLALGTCTYSGYMLYTKNADSAFDSRRKAECTIIGYRTGYPVEWDIDTCWVTLEGGITLPWPDARELIRYNYKQQRQIQTGGKK